jgi:hypothetical protein
MCVRETVFCPRKHVYSKTCDHMTEPSIPEDGSPVVVLEALPDGSLRMNQVEALEDGEAIDLVGPLVIDTRTDKVTHLNIVIGDTHYFVGWNRTNEQWEQILVVVETDEGSEEDEEDNETILESAVSVVDDETGEVVLGFDPNANPDTEEIVEFVWEYVEYTYPETERLYNVVDDTIDELSTNTARKPTGIGPCSNGLVLGRQAPNRQQSC